MWTAEWRIKWRMIMAVIYATFAVAKRKPETKKFRQVRDSNPWPLRYQAWIFFRLSCSNCKSCVCNCDDHRPFKCFLLLLPLLLLLCCFVSLWNCNVLGFHVMKEREPNSKTPHRNFNSMSVEVIQCACKGHNCTEREFFLSFCLLSLSASGEKNILSQHTSWIWILEL